MLDLLQNRLTYKEIGSKLIISPLTVRKHVQNIYQKLNVTSRTEALDRATELGLVEE